MVRFSHKETAERLVDFHKSVEPGLVRVVRLRTPPGPTDGGQEPVALLEVNEETTASGVLPIHFGPDPASQIYHPSIIIEVTPEEYVKITRGELELPNGWELGDLLYERKRSLEAN